MVAFRVRLAGFALSMAAVVSGALTFARDEPGRYHLTLHTKGLHEEIIDTLSGKRVSFEGASASNYKAERSADDRGLGSPGPAGRYQVAIATYDAPRRLLRSDPFSEQAADIAIGHQQPIYEVILDTGNGKVVARRSVSPAEFALVAEESARAASAAGARGGGPFQSAYSTFGPATRGDALAISRTNVLAYTMELDPADGAVVSRTRQAAPRSGEQICYGRIPDSRPSIPSRERKLVCHTSLQWIDPSDPPGSYQSAIAAWGLDNKVLVYETVIDTRDARVVSRHRVSPRVYRLGGQLPKS